MKEVRLWEVEHPYRCEAGCYFSRECHVNHDSWLDFMANGMGRSDEDYNALFRWDWAEGDDHGVAEGMAELRLYFFLQRKAYPISVHVAVTRGDEPEIREWLAQRWDHTKRLWAPFSETP